MKQYEPCGHRELTGDLMPEIVTKKDCLRAGRIVVFLPFPSVR